MQAMKILKTKLMTVLTLRLIKYEKERDKIIYVINASKEKWDEVLI